MKTDFHRSFWKDYKRLPKQMQGQFKDRLRLFIEQPEHGLLHLHPLKGEFEGCWSMNVNGDIRALYTGDIETAVVFIRIGTHSELYE